MKAKQDGKEFVLPENTSIGDKLLLGKQKNEYTVTIGVKPSCSCEFFTRSSASRKEVSCKHIVWAMLSILSVSEENNLLRQVALTESEIFEKIMRARASVARGKKRMRG